VRLAGLRSHRVGCGHEHSLFPSCTSVKGEVCEAHLENVRSRNLDLSTKQLTP